MKAAGLVDELAALLDKRSSLCAQYDAEVDKYKTSRDQTTFNNSLKKLNADYTASGTKVSAHQAALVKEDPDSNDKVLYIVSFALIFVLSLGFLPTVCFRIVYIVEALLDPWAAAYWGRF